MIDIQRLKNMADVKRFAAGAIIVSDGNSGNEMYILLKGIVSIYKNYQAGNELLISELDAGNFFGEMTLFLRKPRTATVVAKTDCIVLAIDNTNALKFFTQQPTAAQSLTESLMGRVIATGKACLTLQKGTVKNDCFFSEMSKPFSYAPSNPKASYIHNMAAGETVKITPSGSLYIVISGAIRANPPSTPLFKQGNFFAGEQLALLEGTAATAEEDSVLLVLTAENIPLFMKSEPILVLKVIQLLCERLDLLNKIQNLLVSRNTNKASILFPEGHQSYAEAIPPVPQDAVLGRYYTCPICKKSFQKIIADTSKLTPVSSDEDYRVHYKEAEPIYYDIITCPQCWFSALREYFQSGVATGYIFNKQYQPYKTAAGHSFMKLATMDDVFTSYYLALYCADACYTQEKDLITAKLWLRLSWIYSDNDDQAMKEKALLNARNAMIGAYTRCKISLPLLVLTGILCCQTDDIKNAKHFLAEARLAQGGDKHKENARNITEKYGLYKKNSE